MAVVLPQRRVARGPVQGPVGVGRVGRIWGRGGVRMRGGMAGKCGRGVERARAEQVWAMLLEDVQSIQWQRPRVQGHVRDAPSVQQ